MCVCVRLALNKKAFWGAKCQHCSGEAASRMVPWLRLQVMSECRAVCYIEYWPQQILICGPGGSQSANASALSLAMILRKRTRENRSLFALPTY